MILNGDIIHGALNTSLIDLWESNTGNRVILDLRGESNNNYTRSNTNIPELYRIVMSKGSDKTNTFTFSDDFTLMGTSNAVEKPVELIHGTLVFDDSDIDIDLSTGGDEFLIINGSALEVKQGEVNISDSDMRLDGCLIVSGGTVDMSSDGNNNDVIYTSSGGSDLLVSDGNLNVGGQLMRNILDASSVLRYTQSNGIARFGINGTSHPERGVFEIIGSGAEYTRSGGTMSIESGNGSSINAALSIVNPTVFSESGASTIMIGGGSNSGAVIGINSTEEINTLELSGAGDNPVASMLINTLQIQNLVIGSGATLNGNDLDVYVSDTWTNNAGLTGFDAGSGNTGTTYSIGSRVDISGDTEFNDFVNSANSLYLQANTELFSNDLRNETSIYTQDNLFHVQGDLVNNVWIYSDLGSLVLDGSDVQYVTSETNSGSATRSRIQKITIDNDLGVELLEYNLSLIHI